MRVYKDKVSQKWKVHPTAKELYETKEQCQRAQMDELTKRLTTIRKKLEEGYLNYGK